MKKAGGSKKGYGSVPGQRTWCWNTRKKKGGAKRCKRFFWQSREIQKGGGDGSRVGKADVFFEWERKHAPCGVAVGGEGIKTAPTVTRKNEKNLKRGKGGGVYLRG